MSLQSQYMRKPCLANLPPELIQMIALAAVERSSIGSGHGMARGTSLASLSSLSLTCKRIEAVCAPVLYRRVLLAGPNRTIIPFLRTLHRRPHLGTYVRVFSVSDWRYDAQQDAVCIAEAQDIVSLNPVARRVLEGTQGLEHVLVFLVLQLLPDLHALQAPSVAWVAQHWPEKERLSGKDLTSIHLTSDNQDGKLPCDGLFEWQKAYQIDKGMVALHELDVRHCCWLRCGSLDEVLWPNPHWASIARSVRVLRLDISAHIVATFSHVLGGLASVPRFSNASQMLSALSRVPGLPNMLSLASPTLGSIMTMLNFAARLEVLDIRTDMTDTLLGDDTFEILQLFRSVTWLGMPMMDIPQSNMHNLTKWPPHLEHYHLSWYALPVTSFVSSIANAVAAGKMPRKVATITLNWKYVFADQSCIPDDVGEYLDLVDALVALDSACQSRSIALVHHCRGARMLGDADAEAFPSMDVLIQEHLLPLISLWNLEEIPSELQERIDSLSTRPPRTQDSS